MLEAAAGYPCVLFAVTGCAIDFFAALRGLWSGCLLL